MATQTVGEAPEQVAEVRTDLRRPRRGYRYGERPGIAYLFLSPWVLGALLLTLGPMLASLYLSFTDYDLFTTPEWVGLENYRRLFTDDERFLTVGLGDRSSTCCCPPRSSWPRRWPWRCCSTGPAGRRASTGRRSTPRRCWARAWRWRWSGGSSSTPTASWTTACRAVGIHTGGWVSSPRYALLVIVAARGVAVRRADGDLPGRAQADPAGAVRRVGRRRRRLVAHLPVGHPADALAGDLLQPGAGDDPRVPGVHRRVRDQRRPRRAQRLDPVLHAVPVPEGLRRVPDGLRVGDGLAAGAGHRARSPPCCSGPPGCGCSTRGRTGEHSDHDGAEPWSRRAARAGARAGLAGWLARRLPGRPGRAALPGGLAAVGVVQAGQRDHLQPRAAARRRSSSATTPRCSAARPASASGASSPTR